MVLSRYANPGVRRWVYGCGEVVSVVMLCVYLAKLADVAEFSEGVFAVIALGFFVLFTLIKRIDKGE